MQARQSQLLAMVGAIALSGVALAMDVSPPKVPDVPKVNDTVRNANDTANKTVRDTRDSARNTSREEANERTEPRRTYTKEEKSKMSTPEKTMKDTGDKIKRVFGK